MKKSISLFFLLLIGILTIPFIVSFVYNEYCLVLFSRSINNRIHKIITDERLNYELLSQGSKVFVQGNDDGCTYMVSSTIRIYATDSFITDIISAIKSAQFYTARYTSSSEHQPEVVVQKVDLTIIITITDGPYDPGLDMRCY